jgi:predicted nucleic acid-binding Zn finger protein
MARTPYNPGKPTVAVKDGDTLLMRSFRGEKAAYRVDVQSGTCSCPHFENRLVGTGQKCKHLVAAEQQQTFAAYVEKAKQVPDSDLPRLLKKYENLGKLDIALAIRAELFDRGQQVAA